MPEPPLRPGTIMLVERRGDPQVPWQWETRLPGDFGTIIASFATEAAARVYGRRQGWCA